MRHCCYCEIEFGIFPQKGDRVSHGVCYRHNLLNLEQVLGSLEAAQAHVDARVRDDLEFCPDMAQVFDG